MRTSAKHLFIVLGAINVTFGLTTAPEGRDAGNQSSLGGRDYVIVAS